MDSLLRGLTRGRTRDVPTMRLNGRTLVLLGAILGLVVLASTDQIVPASSQYQAQMRIWMAARAAGITAYLILTFIVAIGLILSHPVNKSTWKLSKRLFPWHENLLVFVIAFVIAHIVSLILDPYAGVGIVGSLVPGPFQLPKHPGRDRCPRDSMPC